MIEFKTFSPNNILDNQKIVYNYFPQYIGVDGDVYDDVIEIIGDMIFQSVHDYTVNMYDEKYLTENEIENGHTIENFIDGERFLCDSKGLISPLIDVVLRSDNINSIFEYVKSEYVTDTYDDTKGVFYWEGAWESNTGKMYTELHSYKLVNDVIMSSTTFMRCVHVFEHLILLLESHYEFIVNS